MGTSTEIGNSRSNQPGSALSSDSLAAMQDGGGEAVPQWECQGQQGVTGGVPGATLSLLPFP